MNILCPKSFRLFFLIIAVLLVGCDPVRSTRQTVKFKLTDKDGNRVSGFRIELKESFSKKAASTELKKQRQKYWERLPWESSISNENGETIVNVENTMIDRNSGDVAPVTSSIAGKGFQLRLNGGESYEIELNENSTVIIDGISLSVVEISKPIYIQTK